MLKWLKKLLKRREQKRITDSFIDQQLHFYRQTHKNWEDILPRPVLDRPKPGDAGQRPYHHERTS